MTERPTPPPAPRRPERADGRIAVALLGPVLFAPPVLALFAREARLFGVPSLVVYVFAAWLLGILLTALAARRRGGPRGSDG